jgi:hypothetical protein
LGGIDFARPGITLTHSFLSDIAVTVSDSVETVFALFALK